jgi:protein-disulfide isomerase
MSNENKILIGIGIVTVIIISIGAFAFGGSSNSSNTTAPVKKDTKLMVHPDSHQITAKDAKVTLVEFGDFQCPACGAAYPVVEQILQNYKGKINFVFRQYPLQVHNHAQPAAEAAEAAGAQGKFFDMYTALYTGQKDWGESNKYMDYFLTYAKNIGLDVNKFKADVQANKYKNKIQADMKDGDALAIQATPTFFINGVEQEGGLPYDQFKQKIDDAIKAAGGK